jgi:hypothetical protein
MQNPGLTSGLPGCCFENAQDAAVITEILGAACMEQGERMQEEKSPDEDSGFHVGRSMQHRCINIPQWFREQAKPEVTAIQRRANEKGIALIGSEQITKYGRQCN